MKIFKLKLSNFLHLLIIVSLIFSSISPLILFNSEQNINTVFAAEQNIAPSPTPSHAPLIPPPPYPELPAPERERLLEKRISPGHLSSAVSTSAFVTSTPVRTTWSTDPRENTPVSTASYRQGYPLIVSDGAEGAIITWHVYRYGMGYDIYAQRINASGVAQWAINGMAVSTAPYSQYFPQIVSDGAGGAIITWMDLRSGNWDIYAQLLNASGIGQWAANGIAVSNAPYSQYSPQIVSDGTGGAIITWYDYRSGSHADIYAQRLNASGVPQWAASGIAVSTASYNQRLPQIVSDGVSGAIIIWEDYRSGNGEIYAQWLNASGVAQWAANGIHVSTAQGDQWGLQIISDGSGGAIIAWNDDRNGNSDIYVQRINASGVPQWATNGVAISTAPYTQRLPQIVSDGAGGAIITWEDYRSGNNWDIYAQRLNASGITQWADTGVSVSTASYTQWFPQIVSDGAGGAIITWKDNRSRNGGDIYAQRLNAFGIPQWTTNGMAVSTASGTQADPDIVSDGAGGAIITWQDWRIGNIAIYAQRLNASGVPLWADNGISVSSALGGQYLPQIVSDGSRGAIITWHDYRSSINYDIYAQRLNASGVAQWAINGVAVSTAAYDQMYTQIVSDGVGGAIITWMDNRSDNEDIYAQRLNASGVAQWAINGVAVSTAAYDQKYPQIASNGAGGAIITWEDNRTGSHADIYAQLLNASGVAQWAANGTIVSTASKSQKYPKIVSDSIGGAIITWEDSRSFYPDVYAQRLNASGIIQWAANGMAVSAAPFHQRLPQIVSDGVGGAIITWYDNRSGSADIYAQLLNASGIPQWTANGIAVSTASGGQWYPQIISDGSGGAIITWKDYRSDSYADIYAQRLNASGFPQWTVNGVAVSTAPYGQYSHQIVSDGVGGAIITWYDNRSGSADIYVQRLNASGVPQWAINGIVVSMALSAQIYPQIVSDGLGGAIITWEDSRSGSADIYAQKINSSGQLGDILDTISPSAIVNLKTISSNKSGNILLLWTASGDNGNQGTAASYIIKYHISPIAEQNWASATLVSPVPVPKLAGSRESLEVTGLIPGKKYYFAIKVQDEAGNVSGLSNVASANAGLGLSKDKPAILEVKPQYSGTFIHGLDLNNRYNIVVDWNGSSPGLGTPGRVEFRVNGSMISVSGEAGGTSRIFNMGRDFIPDIINKLEITAFSTDGIASDTYELNPKVFSPPSWLDGVMNVVYSGNKAEYRVSLNLLKTLSSSKMPIPANIPVIGGDMGFPTAGGEGSFTIWSDGSGELELEANMGYKVDGVELGGLGQLLARTGLDNQGNFNLKEGWAGIGIYAGLSRFVSILDVIPGLSNLEALPLIGKIIEKFNDIAKIEGKITPEITGNLYFISDNSALLKIKITSGDLIISVDARITLSADILKQLTAGAYGGGTVKPVLAVVPDFYFKELSLKLYYGIWLKIYGWETTLDKPYIWTWSYSPMTQIVTIKKVDFPELKKVEMKPVSREYMKKPFAVFEAGKNTGRIGIRDLPDISTSNLLVSNLYPYAEPFLAGDNSGNMLLLWVQDDPSKPPLQGQEIVYSFWNGTVWSSPTFIVSNTMAEFSPVSAFDINNKAVALWERVKDPNIPSDYDFASRAYEYANKIEIVSSVFNPASSAWTTPVYLTSNDYFDHSPAIAAASSGWLMASWITNTAGKLMGDNANPDTIYYSTWNGNNWSAPQIILTAAYLMSHSLAYKGSEAAMAYILDMDGNIETSNDQELFLRTWGATGGWSGPSRLTNDNISDASPRLIYDSLGQRRLAWIKASQIYLWENNQAFAAPSLSEGSFTMLDYKLAVDNKNNLIILWQGQSPDGADIFYSVYDSSLKSWGLKQRLTKDKDMEEALSPIFDVAGNLRLAYLKTSIVTATKTVSDSQGNQILIENVPSRGQSDLYILKYTISGDLGITSQDIKLSDNNPQSGATITITAEVKNLGDLPFQNPKIAFYDGNPASGGALIGAIKVITPVFTANSTVEASAAWTVPSGNNPCPVYVVVDPLIEISETTKSNNTAFIQSLKPDLQITDFKIVSITPPYLQMEAILKNTGFLPASASTIAFSRDRDFQTRFEVKTMPPLGAGSTQAFTAAWNFSQVATGSYYLYVRADDNNIILEADEDNNKAFIMVPVLPDFNLTPSDMSYGWASTGYTIFATVHNKGLVLSSSAYVEAFALPVATGASLFIDRKALEPMAAGNSSNISFNWASTPGWTGSFLINIDPDNRVVEMDESNNRAHSTVHKIYASTTFQKGWNMWSYPLMPDPLTNSLQIGRYVSPLYVFHYNTASGTYELTNAATPGWGYWIRVTTATYIETEGLPVSIAANFEIPLEKGWNQIGYPFATTVAWSRVQVRNAAGQIKNILDAHAAGWVSQYIYKYNPIAGIYEVYDAGKGILATFLGCWVKANQEGLTLLIPPP